MGAAEVGHQMAEPVDKAKKYFLRDGLSTKGRDVLVRRDTIDPSIAYKGRFSGELVGNGGQKPDDIGPMGDTLDMMVVGAQLEWDVLFELGAVGLVIADTEFIFKIDQLGAFTAKTGIAFFSGKVFWYAVLYKLFLQPAAELTF